MSGNNNSIQQIKNHFKLSSYISKYIEVKQHGNISKALCPFHNEKTPSFTIDDQKKTYHCFGCGAHGDIINFIVEHEGLNHKDAINRLAHEAGIANDFKPSPNYQRKNNKDVVIIKPITKDEISEEDLRKRKEKIKQLNENLEQGKELDDYLQGRYIFKETYKNESLFSVKGAQALAIPLGYPNHNGLIGYHVKKFQKSNYRYETILLKKSENPYLHILNKQDQPEYIFVCEGIETGLSIKQIFKNFNPMIYCCTSATNLSKLVIDRSAYTTSLKSIIICPDHDVTGISKAEDLFSCLEKSISLYKRLKKINDTSLIVAPPPIKESDFNDLLVLLKGKVEIKCKDVEEYIERINNLFKNRDDK